MPAHPATATTDTFVYLDTSALVKLVVLEAESPALDAFLRPRPLWVTSVVTRVELLRVVRRAATLPAAVTHAERVLQRVDLLLLAEDIVAVAAGLEPATLRSLAAIHLASAISLGHDLGGLVTYDARLAEAAGLAGIPVFAPR